MNLLKEQSDPCQFRSHVHISFAPQTPCPEQALAHSAFVNASFDDSSMEVSTFDEILMASCFVIIRIS